MSSNEPQWIEITIKYPNQCLECKKDIIVGQRELWCKGKGVKHIRCNEVTGGLKTEETLPDELKQERPIYDTKIYSFKEARSLRYCQFCGKELPLKGDAFINCERKSCSKCFVL
ncbi:hypothetical protein OAU44_00455 [bacterium]|nr:hypothetical protein [bacterium]